MSGGISIWALSNGLIEQNHIEGCGYGILCYSTGANPTIRGNVLLANNIHPDTLNWGFGLACNGNNAPIVTRNWIRGHGYGVAIVNGGHPNLGDLQRQVLHLLHAPRRPAERPVGGPLDRRTVGRAESHRNGKGDDEARRDPQRRAGGAREHSQHNDPEIRPQHVDLAVGEVDQLEYPVDHGVAERDQRVDAPARQAAEEQLEEVLHAQAAAAPGGGYLTST